MLLEEIDLVKLFFVFVEDFLSGTEFLLEETKFEEIIDIQIFLVMIADASTRPYQKYKRTSSTVDTS